MKPYSLPALAVVLFAAACAPVRTAPIIQFVSFSPFTVLLQPKANPAPGVLDVKSGNQGCSQGAGAKKGCVRFDKGNIGTITFALFGEDAGDRCDPNGSADWVITKVQLSREGDSDTEKGVFGGAQPPWLVAAFPGTDPADGTVYSATTATGETSVGIIDLNNHAGEEFVYYQVTATNCETDQQVDIDPMVQNKGK